MKRARLLVASLRHTRPRQLVERARLTARRRILERLPALGDRRASLPGGEIPALARELPPPVFPARAELAATREGRTLARFLNLEYPIDLPLAWHPAPSAVGQHLGQMHLHYMEYLEALDDERLRATVLDWIENNPPYRRGYWLYDWNAYTVSIRTVTWMQQLAARGLLADRGFAARVTGSLTRQLRFLERNVEIDIRGNHLIKNVKALLWAGRFFAGGAARAWRDLGERLLDEELAEQILPDGMHFERSPAYHAQVTADLVECRTVLPPGERRNRLDRALDRAAQALADLTHPDGAPSLFNDGGLHMSRDASLVLDAVARAGRKRRRPRHVFALERAGYFGARHGDDLVVVDCGAIGPDHLPAHAHGDVLAFEWSIAGQRAVVDAGVFEYQAGSRRDRSRATGSHNTLTLDDRDQAEFWSSFRVGRRPQVTLRRFDRRTDGFVLEGAHDGYAGLDGSPVHVRRFEVGPRRIAVEDRVEGGRGQRARARLLVAPGVSVRVRAGGVDLAAAGFRVGLATAAPVEVIDAAWWPDFGVEVPTRQIVLDYGPAPCAGAFVLDKAP